MRNSNQVVVTAEILKQVKIPKSHCPKAADVATNIVSKRITLS